MAELPWQSGGPQPPRGDAERRGRGDLGDIEAVKDRGPDTGEGVQPDREMRERCAVGREDCAIAVRPLDVSRIGPIGAQQLLAGIESLLRFIAPREFGQFAPTLRVA